MTIHLDGGHKSARALFAHDLLSNDCLVAVVRVTTMLLTSQEPAK